MGLLNRYTMWTISSFWRHNRFVISNGKYIRARKESVEDQLLTGLMGLMDPLSDPINKIIKWFKKNNVCVLCAYVLCSQIQQGVTQLTADSFDKLMQNPTNS